MFPIIKQNNTDRFVPKSRDSAGHKSRSATTYLCIGWAALPMNPDSRGHAARSMGSAIGGGAASRSQLAATIEEASTIHI